VAKAASERFTITPEIDWSRLSDRGAWILVAIEMPISLGGRSYADVAAAVGFDRTRIGALRRELREELADCLLA
jgi:hypothetical protein